jgi:hypothetical protein
MDLSSYASKFKVSSATREQGLATEIYESFGRIMAIINRTGWQATFEAWKASTREGVKNPVALFLWKARQNAKAVVFKNTNP